jgi:hypothetical protein
VRVIVFRLRQDGRRMAEIRWSNAPVGPGQLEMYRVLHGSESYAVISLTRPGQVKDRQLLPELYEPVLVTIGHNRLLFRGYERSKDDQGARGVVQEWLCEVSA